MSEANRKKVYDKLVENDKLGKTPGLAQDDGALKEEFGDPGTPAVEEPKKKGKK